MSWWCVMMSHHDSSWWFFMIHRDESAWCIMMKHHDSSWWIIMIRRNESSCLIMMNHHESPWWIIMIHHDESWISMMHRELARASLRSMTSVNSKLAAASLWSASDGLTDKLCRNWLGFGWSQFCDHLVEPFSASVSGPKKVYCFSREGLPETRPPL